MADITQITFVPISIHQHYAAGSIDAATTLSKIADADKLIIQAITQNVRMTLAGTPTSVAGFRLTAGNDPILVPISDTGIIRVISETAGAILEYQWGK